MTPIMLISFVVAGLGTYGGNERYSLGSEGMPANSRSGTSDSSVNTATTCGMLAKRGGVIVCV